MVGATPTVHNAVDRTFERLSAAGRLAFIPYLTAGYPDAESALLLGQTLAAHGADLLEVGVSFSDPIGDGPTIQRSSSVALAHGTFLRRVRARAALPLVVGFGLSRPEHVERLHAVADGAVVASALIDLMDTTPPAVRESAVAAYVERMSAACSDS